MSFGGDVEVCPNCARAFPAGTLQCPYDTSPLQSRVPTAAQDPLIGATIDGKFTILKRLGAGGMGVVYVARQTSLDRVVALKVLAPRDGRDSTMEQRFRTEARAASQLRSRHAVTVHDFGVTPEGLLYIAMSMAKGETLRAMVTRGRLTPRDATLIASQIADALAEAHAHEPTIVHRDIKPDNVMVELTRDKTPFAVVLDFGLALLASDPRVTASDMVVGTPSYVSPEQAIIGGNPGVSVDVYALGVTLYEMLCGHPPFQSTNNLVLLPMHLNDPPVRLRSLVPEISLELDAFVHRMLAKKSALRPSAADVRSRLERLTDDYLRRPPPRTRIEAGKKDAPTPVTEPEVLPIEPGATEHFVPRAQKVSPEKITEPEVPRWNERVRERKGWFVVGAVAAAVVGLIYLSRGSPPPPMPTPATPTIAPVAAVESPKPVPVPVPAPEQAKEEIPPLQLPLPKSHHTDSTKAPVDVAPAEAGAVIDPAVADRAILSEAGLMRPK